ncbi:PTS transporter subunit EIIB [Mycoplasmopsis felis]|uniref:PTS transporter subunit EIIB n=1 Tax=Mycoplasmopsis felis TaxID=33923 RepID=UPI0021AF2776|nr:PTS transporter subunit EIIB [Mycoplasmopsis felis]UWW01265.1 PTS transporter subunit EIIB [Mycoplasmopsis felis]
MDNEVPKKVIDIVNAFGGIHNIVGFSNSVSELRYDLKNLSIVSKDDLIKQGATNIILLWSKSYSCRIWWCGRRIKFWN